MKDLARGLYGAERDRRNDTGRAGLHQLLRRCSRASITWQSRSEWRSERRSGLSKRLHTIGQDGWEEVADYALDWAVDHARHGQDINHGA
jgi:hypothetical protein